MRLHRCVPMLAALVSSAGMIGPAAAQAKFDETTFPPLGVPYVAHHNSGSTDWALIGLGAAGGIALIGVGTAGTRRAVRRTTGVGATSGS
jgi:hypothetical protein